MPTLEEMTAWSAEEIEGAIRCSLPAGFYFECGLDQEAGAWFARFWRPSESQRTVLYQDWGIDQRLTYFNAYGWLWAQKQPKPPAHSLWARRREVTRETVQQRAFRGVRVPDPPDLDPEQIEAVYADTFGKPKK